MYAPGFCVVIPMYNEESGAERCILAVTAQLRRMPQRSVLVAVNDGSKDRTPEILEALSQRVQPLAVIHHPANRGYGAALRTGVDYAAAHAFDYCVFMDSDLTNDPADLPAFAVQMQRGIDVIKASRFRSGGGMRGVPWQRSIFSVSGNLIARILFGLGIKDCTNGFRAVKTSILREMDLRERGFPIILEELYHCKFLASTFSEVPVVLTSRTGEQRPTSFTYDLKTLKKYFSYAWKSFVRQRPEALRQVPPSPKGLP
jgi:glycosyltransferase involved in cell wall biosynthesis